MRVPIAVPLTGGVNLFQAPHDIRDDEFIRGKNLYPPTPGQLATRPASAFSFWASTAASMPLGLQFLPINAPADFVLTTRLMAGTAQNTKLLAFVRDISPAAAVATADFGAVTPYGASLISYLGKVYGFGGLGSNANGKYLFKNSATGNVEFADFAFSTAGNEGLRPHLVGNYRERFVYLNMGPGFESAFIFADPFAPDVITANALAVNGGYGLVNPDDGDRITAGLELTQTGGTDIQSTFLILKEWSAFLLSGEPLFADGTGPDTLQTMKLPVNCGCSSQATVCKTPFGVIWAGPDDVWFFPEGQLPYRVGTKIRPALQASPANVRYRWHAVFDQGFYKLALFGAGQGPTDDSPCGEQYWLDMRSGMPSAGPEAWREARWYGPIIFKSAVYDSTPFSEEGTRAMAVDVKPGSDRAMTFMAATDNAAAGYTTGALGSHDSVYPGLEAHMDTEIECELITKNYKSLVSGGQLVADGVVEKGFLGAELAFKTTTSGLLAWKWIVGTKSVGSEQTIEVLPDGFILGTGTLGTGVVSEADGAVGLDPGSTRVFGRSIQLKIYSLPGYYIDDTNDLVVMDVDIGGAVIVQVRAPLTQGYYATRDALATHVADVLTAALTGYPPTIAASHTGNYVRFTNSTGNELQFGVGHCPAADEAKVRSLAHLLGFTDWDNDYEGLSTVTATQPVYSRNVLTWEINSGMVMHMYTIPRRLL